MEITENNLKQNLGQPPLEALRLSVAELYYMSESDEPFEVFESLLACSEALTPHNLAIALGKKNLKHIEELTCDAFFEPLLSIQDWYGDEEKRTASKFLNLKQILAEYFKEVKVFRVGARRVKIYLLGSSDQLPYWSGLKTLSVETD